MPSRRCSGEFDQEQSAERPESLAAEALFALLVDHDDALAGVSDFGRGNEPGEASADHNYVRIVSHAVSPGPGKRIEARGISRGQRLAPAGTLDGIVNLFHFGTFAAAGCSAPATLNLNLI